VSLAAVGLALLLGARHPLALLVAALAALAVSTPLAALAMDGWRRNSFRPWRGCLEAFVAGRRQYAGYVVHIGFACVALGITGSSLGTQRREFVLREGQVVAWADRRIEYVKLDQHSLADKLVAEAVLRVSRPGREPVTLRPARHLHLLQNQWTTEVAIDSTLGGDFYTILHAGLGDGRVSLTFVENPLMQCIWLGGLVSLAGALAAMIPARGAQRAAQPSAKPTNSELSAAMPAPRKHAA
jgi:cytochrome c-type biogenesis protein CcmF